jgi:tetratricopeptide (TPR) repeat protein
LIFFVSIPFCLQAELEFSEFSFRGFEGQGEVEFNSPEDILLTQSGEIIIADQKNHRLQVLTAKGEFIRTIPSKTPPPASVEAITNKNKRSLIAKYQNYFREPIGMAFDNDGRLFVSLMKDDIIMIIDYASGNIIDTLGRSGRAHGEFNSPMDIDISSNNILAVAEFRNKRVQVLDLEGKCLKELRYQIQNSRGSVSSVEPRGVYWTNDNRLIVTYPTYHQVVCWEPFTGEVIWRYGGNKGADKGELNNPSFICGGVNGTILVTDTLNHRVVEITRDGKFSEHYGRRGNAQGKIYVPRGLALTADENLIIAEQGNNRIHFFQPGRVTLTLREAKRFALKDDWSGAMPLISRVLYLQPNNEQARDLMVNALYYFGNEEFEKGNYSKAEENYRRILKYRPNDESVSEKLQALFWASNQETIILTVLVVLGLMFILFSFWIIKVLIVKFIKNKNRG